MILLQVCEKRPDLLNVSVDFLLELKDYIMLVIETSPKNFFKTLELIPPKFLTPDNQQDLLESFMLWHGFCRKVSFNNYVDMILPFFDHLPTSTWTFFTLNVDKNGDFCTTYPPHLVHVVIERPQRQKRRLECEKEEMASALDEAEAALEAEENRVIRTQLELTQLK